MGMGEASSDVSLSLPAAPNVCLLLSWLGAFCFATGVTGLCFTPTCIYLPLHSHTHRLGQTGRTKDRQRERHERGVLGEAGWQACGCPGLSCAI